MALEWKDIAGFVGKSAPLLGTLLGGPAGAAVGGIVASILGVGNGADSVNAALAGDPAKALELAKYELDNKERLQAMAYAHGDSLITAANAAGQQDVDDRKSARTAAVEGKTSGELFWLSIIIIVVTLSAEIFVLFAGAGDKADPLIVGRVLGLLDAALLLVLNFNFGSSAGSKRATELLAQAGPAQPPP